MHKVECSLMLSRLASFLSAADIDLGEIIFAGRTEEDVDLETRLPQQLREIGTEFGEDGVTPVPTRVRDPWGAVLDGAVGPDDRPGEGFRGLGQERDREDVAPAG